ncbi:MAG: hypothetical protein ACD_74C00158G0010 [uncultured bacterium]|nr:MAG: hypothetical protein ACD_74C00158G0010 [uncultured bacterium]
MAIHNKKHLMIKDSQRRITFAEFAAIQDSLGLSNEQIALLLGLSLSTVESFHGTARQKDLCGSPATASILLLKFLDEHAPGTFSRVKDGFHAWAFAYKPE